MTHEIPPGTNLSDQSLISSSENRTKLDIVITELKANPTIFYAGEIFKELTVRPGYGSWSETVDIIVAPKAPIFDIDRLNRFMHGLVTSVEPTQHDDAYPNDSRGGIHLGRLYFDEPIAHIHSDIQRVVTAIDPDAANRLKLTLGTSEEHREEDIFRRAWVRLYPEPVSAQTMYDYERSELSGDIVSADARLPYREHWLESQDVEKLKALYRKGPLSKITGLFQSHR
jgi:hypothetical protein